MTNEGLPPRDPDKLGDRDTIDAEEARYERTQVSQRYRLTLTCEALHHERDAVARQESARSLGAFCVG